MKCIGNTIICMIAVLSLLGVAACGAEGNDAEKAKSTEVKALLERMDDLEEEVQSLREKVKEMQRAIDSDKTKRRVFHRRGASDNKELEKELDSLVMPDNPNEAQVREYVEAVLLTAKKQNSFSVADPQVAKLKKIPKKYLGFLCDLKIEYKYRFNTFYVDFVLKEWITPNHKALVLSKLERCPDFAEYVVRYEWESDAHDTLVRVLASHPDYLPTEWIKAVANLKDKKTYSDLEWYFITRREKAFNYKELKKLPGFDLDRVVRKAWKYSNSDLTPIAGYKRAEIAIIALEHGIEDALQYLLSELSVTGGKRFWVDTDIIISNIGRHVEFVGSLKEITKWYNDNKGNLVFDRERKVFKVKKAVTDAADKPEEVDHGEEVPDELF